MRTLVTFINRKTNLQIYNTLIDLSKITESQFSPNGIFNYIWKYALANGMAGNKEDYLIKVFNEKNHLFSYESYGFSSIKETLISSRNKSSVIYLEDYKNKRLLKSAG